MDALPPEVPDSLALSPSRESPRRAGTKEKKKKKYTVLVFRPTLILAHSRSKADLRSCYLAVRTARSLGDEIAWVSVAPPLYLCPFPHMPTLLSYKLRRSLDCILGFVA